VDHSLFVSRLKPLGYLPADARSFVDRQRPFADFLCQRLAFNKLHHNEASSLGLFQPMDRGNVGMIERRQELGLALEAGHSLRITGECIGEEFERSLASQIEIFGHVDFPHATLAKLAL
jgi:hypothetical protein